jgi:DNA-binding MarR family transcriptional regulator
MKTLTIISEHKNPSMKDIADELGISSPATTAIIDRLIEDKSITRAEDKDDRRMTRISLTPIGKKTFEKTREVLYAAINNRVSILSETEQKELARILLKLQSPQ